MISICISGFFASRNKVRTSIFSFGVNKPYILSPAIIFIHLSASCSWIRWYTRLSPRNSTQFLCVKVYWNHPYMKWCRWWDSNPYALGARDFKSLVSAIPPQRRLVEVAGFEPATSCSQNRGAATALHLDVSEWIVSRSEMFTRLGYSVVKSSVIVFYNRWFGLGFADRTRNTQL